MNEINRISRSCELDAGCSSSFLLQGLPSCSPPRPPRPQLRRQVPPYIVAHLPPVTARNVPVTKEKPEAQIDLHLGADFPPRMQLIDAPHRLRQRSDPSPKCAPHAYRQYCPSIVTRATVEPARSASLDMRQYATRRVASCLGARARNVSPTHDRFSLESDRSLSQRTEFLLLRCSSAQ
jgi:hypothetical protein